jgi:dTDP-4-dehydrorhamnose 3,5-epimerase
LASAYFSRAHERGTRWDDPQLKIDWPVAAEDAIVSDKDRALPFFRDIEGFV